VKGKKVSKQQILVMAEFIAEPRQWHQSRDIEHKTGVTGSTVRHLLFTLFRFNLLERFEAFGGYRYRLSPTAQVQPYFRRLQEATVVMQA
jgi:hypothetical protein